MAHAHVYLQTTCIWVHTRACQDPRPWMHSKLQIKCTLTHSRGCRLDISVIYVAMSVTVTLSMTVTASVSVTSVSALHGKMLDCMHCFSHGYSCNLGMPRMPLRSNVLSLLFERAQMCVVVCVGRLIMHVLTWPCACRAWGPFCA